MKRLGGGFGVTREGREPRDDPTSEDRLRWGVYEGYADGVVGVGLYEGVTIKSSE